MSTFHPTWFDWITVLALIAGPVSALYIQRCLDSRREKREKKLKVFKTLMTYRAQRLNPEFVQALNTIEMEFSDPTEKPVRDAWKVLLDHFIDMGNKTPEQRQADQKQDNEQAGVLTTKLLVLMGSALGYDFDEVTVKKGCYYPEALGNIEQEQHALRWAFLSLLAGNLKLPVAVFDGTQLVQQAQVAQTQQPQPPAKANGA